MKSYVLSQAMIIMISPLEPVPKVAHLLFQWVFFILIQEIL